MILGTILLYLFITPILLFLIAFCIYWMLCLIGILIPCNRNFKPSDQGIDVYISSNGLHTDIIVPFQNEHFDWRKILNDPTHQNLNLQSNFLGFGLGEKSVYLDINKVHLRCFPKNPQ